MTYTLYLSVSRLLPQCIMEHILYFDVNYNIYLYIFSQTVYKKKSLNIATVCSVPYSNAFEDSVVS